jgi:hypothetical protein
MSDRILTHEPRATLARMAVAPMKQYDLKPSFTKWFPPSHPNEAAFGYLVRDIARTYFEFLRNLLVVGALKVIADATGNVVVGVIYAVSLIMLVQLFYSFIVQFDLKVFRHRSERAFAVWLDFLLSLVFALVCTGACWWLIDYVAAQIVAAKA